MLMNNKFLDSANFISENQAEYSILTDLYSECENKIFIFELSDLNLIKYYYGEVVRYINGNYKSFNLNKFSLNSDGKLNSEMLSSNAGSSLKDEELFNIALEITSKNKSYGLVRAKESLVLIHNGKFDQKFNNIFVDRQTLLDSDRKKRNIDQLELVFENFHSERKYKGCEYVDGLKIKNSVSEQELRNSLIKYLRDATNLHIVPELCTTKTNDEESVDVGVIDSDNRVAIIEVKYFVKKGFFVDPDKKAYSESRFRDGYEQLNKYCIHLNKDNYKLHSAFLYMFFAHSVSEIYIKEKASSYYKEFIARSDCSIDFTNHYKDTVCDNMIDIKV